MTTTELEIEKSLLVQEILNTDNMELIKKIRKVCNQFKKKILTDESEYISKEEILAGIDAGLKDVRMSLDGKLKLKTAKEFLDEL